MRRKGRTISQTATEVLGQEDAAAREILDGFVCANLADKGGQGRQQTRAQADRAASGYWSIQSAFVFFIARRVLRLIGCNVVIAILSDLVLVLYILCHLSLLGVLVPLFIVFKSPFVVLFVWRCAAKFVYVLESVAKADMMRNGKEEIRYSELWKDV